MHTFELDFFITHEELLKITSLFSDIPGTCLLYSGGELDSAAKSFLFLFPFESVEILTENNPWDVLIEKVTHKKFWVGFLAYEMGLYANKLNNIYSSKLPKAYFQQSAFRLIVDHKLKKSFVSIQNVNHETFSDAIKEWLKNFSDLNFWKKFLSDLPEILKDENSQEFKKVHDFDSLESYTKKISEIQEMINDGDVYQVNLSHQKEILSDKNPFDLFVKLMEINPSPFAAYFKHKNYTIVSSSPERFLKLNEGILETRPIKGTIARGRNLQEDIKNREKLLSSQKDLSELVMITDLLRNDLGKISVAGSVKTLKIASLEAYTNVYHLLSIIQSIPLISLRPLDILKSCFPGGSITGCPKLKAMQVIQKLEKRSRGVYTGSIGYIDENGCFDFNIAIRTLIFYQNKINIQLGGAITSDSIAVDEYNETMQKGESIFRSLI